MQVKKNSDFADVWLYDSLKEVSAEIKSLRSTCAELTTEIRLLAESNIGLKIRIETLTARVEKLSEKETENTTLKDFLKKLAHPGYLVILALLGTVGVTSGNAHATEDITAAVLKTIKEAKNDDNTTLS